MSDRLGASDPGTATPFRAMAITSTWSIAKWPWAGRAAEEACHTENQRRDVQPASKPMQCELRLLEAVGEHSVHARAVHGTICVARAKCNVPPDHERLESCKTFLDRTKKQARSDRRSSGTKDHLRDRSCQRGTQAPPVVMDNSCSRSMRWQETWSSLKADNRAKWTGTGPPCGENVPPMPTADLQDLNGWFGCFVREFGRPRSETVGKGILVLRQKPILHSAPFSSTHIFPCLNRIFKNGSFLSVVALVSVTLLDSNPLPPRKKIDFGTDSLDLGKPSAYHLKSSRKKNLRTKRQDTKRYGMI